MSGLFGRVKRPVAKQASRASGLTVQTSVYGKPIAILYGTNRVSPNLIWYGNFAATPQHGGSGGHGGKGGAVGGGGGAKGGGVGGSVSYTYSASIALGLCEGPALGFGALWTSKTEGTLNASPFSAFEGGLAQAPWSYLESFEPSEALGYSGLVYVAAPNYQLGSSPHLPNFSVEVEGLYSNSVSGWEDADPSLVVADLLTNPIYGAGFPAARVGSLATYQDYCLSVGLVISPAYDTQAAASSLLDDIAKYTNSAFVWSSGTLTLVPYGDQAASGNGKTYSPPSAPLFDLTDDDFLPNTGVSGAAASSNQDPVLLTRKRPSDAMNSVKLEFLDRTNQYAPSIVEAKDEAAINLYGLRAQPSSQAHLFCAAACARLSAQLLLQRQAIRNLYQFTLDQRYLVLDPMDIVTISDSTLGLDRQWVRITEITEDQDGNLSILAEEYLDGTGSAAQYAVNPAGGYSVNYNADPGNALTPVIFDASPEIAQSGTEVWLASAGGANWGGADVWISTDGDTYRLAGTMKNPCRMGVATSALPLSGDPDTADTLGVDLTNGGVTAPTLLSGTQADADAWHTLCRIDNELISFETATLTATGKYNLTYLRRGVYDSTVAAHSIGASFVRLDEAIFKYPYAISQIGQKIFVKLVSFNIYGGGLQDIAEVSAYSYTIQGPTPPADVANFSVQQNGSVVVFAWDPVPDYFLKGYDIRYAAQGVTDWNAMTPLTDSAAGTEMTNAAVPPGTWVFAIRAHDKADQLSAALATQDLVVVNENPLVASAPQAPDWLGTLTGCLKHWTGVLVPDSTLPANQLTNAQLFEQFVPFPVAAPTYDAPTIDTGFDDTMRVWAAMAASLGRGASGLPSESLAIDFWLTGQSDPATFEAWTVASASLRYLRARLTMTPAEGCSYVTTFTPTIDRAPKIENGASVTIAAGGTAIEFPSPYHVLPLVQATAVGSSALIATAADISTTGFTAHVFNSAGSDVGGTINWQSSGT